MKVRAILIALVSWAALALSPADRSAFSQENAQPHRRVVLDAHNCYPYYEWWFDRIDRALSADLPVAIEQDLLWAKNPRTGNVASVLSHGGPPTGTEPGMREYFFERIRPIVERALRDGNRSDWPLITLNLDLKSEEPEHLAAIWALLSEYKDWLTSAARTDDSNKLEPLQVRPVLVLTGESDAQRRVFYEPVRVGDRLLVFGAVKTNTTDPAAAPEVLAPSPADNYHRWWNNAWRVVEPEGQSNASAWTAEKESRLNQLVTYAHKRNLWIRFYTLDGATRAELSCNGWFRTYNFGSREAVQSRWAAAWRARVDYLASDQYEELGNFLKGQAHPM
jgi:hypothetical protein